MKGSVTGKVVDWANGETMDQMIDQFGPWDYTGSSQIFQSELQHKVPKCHFDRAVFDIDRGL